MYFNVFYQFVFVRFDNFKLNYQLMTQGLGNIKLWVDINTLINFFLL